MLANPKGCAPFFDPGILTGLKRKSVMSDWLKHQGVSSPSFSTIFDHLPALIPAKNRFENLVPEDQEGYDHSIDHPHGLHDGCGGETA